MPPGAARPLTDRQRDVVKRIDRRVPIKVIAQELGVSETRINQHIRALKDIFEAASLNELVEKYRASQPVDDSDPQSSDSDKGLSGAAYTKKQLADGAGNLEGVEWGDQAEVVFSDVASWPEQASWLHPESADIAPGIFDGQYAVLYRLAAIAGIAFGILASVILAVTAALALSDVMDGGIEKTALERQA